MGFEVIGVIIAALNVRISNWEIKSIISRSSRINMVKKHLLEEWC